MSTGYMPPNASIKQSFELIDVDDADLPFLILNDLLDDDVIVETLPNTSITWYYRHTDRLHGRHSLENLSGIKQVHVVSEGSNNYGIIISPVKKVKDIDFVSMIKSNNLIQYCFGTIKATFRIREVKKNPGIVWSVEGIFSILVGITFCITCLLQATGYSESVPPALARAVDIVLGFLFGRGTKRYETSKSDSSTPA